MLSKYIQRRAGTPTEELFVENVAVRKIAEAVGTPTYIYSKAEVCDSFDAYQKALSPLGAVICVSVKANSNLSLLALLAKRGAGFDVVSGGELQRVLTAGGDPRKVVFAGVGKTDDEIHLALSSGILMLNVESVAELRRINELAGKLGKRAGVALRVNPNVDAKTHAYISTGMEEHKFGIPLAEAKDLYARHKEFANVEFVGVDCHIGSMITDFSAFQAAFSAVANFVREVRAVAPSIRYVDVGGGLAVSYKPEVAPPEMEKYAAAVREALSGLDVQLLFEPGRSIFANAGLLLTRVTYIKENSKKQFVIADAGFNDLIRPALYQAHHHIELVQSKNGSPTVPVDLVGPICESGDWFAKARELPQAERGDLVVLYSAGAYGFTMASNYNTRPRAAEVLVDGDTFVVVRPREKVEALYAEEIPAMKAVIGASSREG